MATKDAGDALQTDQQLAETHEDAMRAAVSDALLQVHTCLPGIIKSFDAAKQTAVVQATIKRQYMGKPPEALPLCVDVPVVFPEGGGIVFTFPVTAGDECLLVFSERAIDFWWEKGGVQEAADHRFHDLSDAFAIVGVRSKARVLAGGVASGAAEVRRASGGGTAAVAREGDTCKITLGIADINALATALLATTAFVASSNPPAYSGPAVPLLDGEITSGSSILKAGD